jgi:hypothetical protein
MGIDWSATGGMLSGIGTIGGALAVGVTALLGRSALKDYQAQRQVERRMAHAEALLASAYQLEMALDSIRSPMSTASELDASRQDLEDRNQLSGITKEKSDRFVQANVFYIRAKYFDEQFEEAVRLLPYAAAFFGKEVKDALYSLIHNRHSVRAYADAYAQSLGHDKDFDKKIQAGIWKGFGKVYGEDEITDKTANSISVLEQNLFPIIRPENKKRFQLRKNSNG